MGKIILIIHIRFRLTIRLFSLKISLFFFLFFSFFAFAQQFVSPLSPSVGIWGAYSSIISLQRQE